MSNTKTKTKPTPHPHAHWIKLWADGVPIEYKACGKWIKVIDFNTMTMPDIEYRIKPETEEPWKPKEGEKYFYLNVINGRIVVDWITWNNDEIDNALYCLHNVFHTEKEAEATIPTVRDAIKIALKGGDSLMSKKSCLLELEVKDAEIKTLKEQVETAKKRVEDARKSGELKALDDYIKKYLEGEGKRTANQAVVDGKPLSDGEKALIKALRESTIDDVFKQEKSTLVYTDKEGDIKSIFQFVAFTTDELMTSPWIISALEQIKAEQDVRDEEI